MPPDPPRPGSKETRGERQGAVYFEFVVQGAFVKVTAIDEETGTEVSIVGAATTPQPILQRTALAKLKYVLGKTA